MNRKLLLCCAALSASLLLGGCNDHDQDGAPDDGIYNPERKISTIYGQYLLPDGNLSEEELNELWFWTGNRLSAIGNEDEIFLSYIYQGDRMVEMYSYSNYLWRFFYNGSALTSIDHYDNNVLIENLKVSSRQGKHITGMEITGIQSGSPAMGDLAILFDKHLSEGITKIAQQAGQAADPTKARRSMDIHLSISYTGDNVAEVIISANDQDLKATYTYTYDDKKNPHYALYSSGQYFLSSRNNPLTLKVVYEGDRRAVDDEEINYTYQYDGEWPVKITETDGDYTIIRHIAYR